MGNTWTYEPEEDPPIELNNHSHGSFLVVPQTANCEERVEGYLQKQPTNSDSVIVENRWRERYFVLRRGGIFYYLIDKETHVPLQDVEWISNGHVEPLVGHVTQLRSGSEIYTFASPIMADHIFDLRKVHMQEYQGTIWERWTEVYIVKQGSEIILQQRRQMGMFPLGGQVRMDGAILHITGADHRTLTVHCGEEENAWRWKNAIDSTHRTPHRTGETVEFHNTLHDVLTKWPPTPTLPARKQQPYFILSIDGGGTRGIISCIILERIFQQYPEFLNRVNMVAGTSNGALISMGLAFGHQITTIRKMTELISQSVFCEQQSRFSFTQAKWSNRFLSLFCNEVWGNSKMLDAKIPCMVPALLLDDKNENEEKRSMQTQYFSEQSDEKVSDVLMRTCSAPTYFESWQGYVDGGLFAHCPADLAITHALKQGVLLEDIVMLSISTGHVAHYMAADTDQSHNYGMYQWVTQLTPTVWTTMVQKTTMLCENMLGDRFHRIDPCMTEDLALDQANLLPQMARYGNEVDLHLAFDWLSHLPTSQ